MKTNMDDAELVGLESSLRRSVVGHAPDAPDSLLRFIDTVPASAGPAHRLELIHFGPRVRRSFMAVATVAAVIVAIVAGAALVSVRNGRVGPTSNAASSPTVPGWSWQRADGALVQDAFEVPNGYIGLCGTRDQTLCSSPDALHWTTPADTKILVVEGSGQFAPVQVVEWGGIFVAFDQPTIVGSVPANVIWRSTDGLHWSQVNSPAFSGLTVFSVDRLPSGFVALSASTPDQTGEALTSTDGLTWSEASQFPVQPESSSAGAAGLFVGSSASNGGTWRTLDGKTWARVMLPGGIFDVHSYQIPGGGFVGVTSSNSGSGEALLRSDDGLTWTADQGVLPGSLATVAVVGDRLIADISALPWNSTSYPDASAFAENAFTIWQSTDWGRTWQPVVDATGHQMQGLVRSLGDRLAVASPDMATTSWTIAWVGTPTDSAMPVLSPAPATTAPPGATGSSSGPTSTIVYQLVAPQGGQVTSADLDATVAVLQKRVDSLGASGTVEKLPPDRVAVHLAGVADLAALGDSLAAIGNLEFVPLPGDLYGKMDTATGVPMPVAGSVALPAAGSAIDPSLKPLFASPNIDPNSVSVTNGATTPETWEVQFTLSGSASDQFAAWSGQNVGAYFAVVLDGKVVEVPFIMEPITDGSVVLSGSFTKAQAEDMAMTLRDGRLPMELREASGSSASPGPTAP
jgi:hypothetical protein